MERKFLINIDYEAKYDFNMKDIVYVAIVDALENIEVMKSFMVEITEIEEY